MPINRLLSTLNHIFDYCHIRVTINLNKNRITQETVPNAKIIDQESIMMKRVDFYTWIIW